MSKPATIGDEVLSLLAEHRHGLRAGEIKSIVADRAGTTVKTVAAEISKLKEKGYVQSIKYGHWMLTDRGLAYVMEHLSPRRGEAGEIEYSQEGEPEVPPGGEPSKRAGRAAGPQAPYDATAGIGGAPTEPSPLKFAGAHPVLVIRDSDGRIVAALDIVLRGGFTLDWTMGFEDLK